MFKPYMIPAIAKTHELITSHAKISFIDTHGNLSTGHFRGYSNSDGSLEDSTVRVLIDLHEVEYPFSGLVELAHNGMLGKFRG